MVAISYSLPGYDTVVEWHTYATPPVTHRGREPSRDLLLARRITHLSIPMLTEILVNRAMVCLAAGPAEFRRGDPSLWAALDRLGPEMLDEIASKSPGVIREIQACMPRAGADQETRSIRCMRLMGFSIPSAEYQILTEVPVERRDTAVSNLQTASLFETSGVGRAWYTDFVLSGSGVPQPWTPLYLRHIAKGAERTPTRATVAAVDRATGALTATGPTVAYIEQLPDQSSGHLHAVLRVTLERWREAGG